ncbi:hypothetical protein ACGFX4_19350 [Kitasatospora sp. NPDC048365]|uniref:hypothetical protein n=1 Tax=Kitasatospora sp. NPDC048365 TaxID=3364050 RepID=UPI003717CCF2
MGGRTDSDEAYVLDLCDEHLGEAALRQHRFDWLRGDPGPDGRRARLPVDGYWRQHKLVVEYRERQHDEPAVRAHKLRLAVIRPDDLDADDWGRLHRRNRPADLAAIGALLAPVLQVWHSDEDRVVDVFRTWLTGAGWTIVPPTDPHADLEAVRNGERVIAEAKGHTSDPGIGADIAYGQLLRRMTAPDAGVRYAIVVPTSAVRAALRVPEPVRARLGITVYEVTVDGAVNRHGT